MITAPLNLRNLPAAPKDDLSAAGATFRYAISSQIHAKRLQLEWTVHDVIDRLPITISPSTLFRCEAGRRDIPSQLLWEVCAALDLDVVHVIANAARAAMRLASAADRARVAPGVAPGGLPSEGSRP